MLAGVMMAPRGASFDLGWAFAPKGFAGPSMFFHALGESFSSVLEDFISSSGSLFRAWPGSLGALRKRDEVRNDSGKHSNSCWRHDLRHGFLMCGLGPSGGQRLASVPQQPDER